MWKLTITQKRKSEYSDYTTTEHIELVSTNFHELVETVDKLTCLDDEAIETTYKIERQVKNNGI